MSRSRWVTLTAAAIVAAAALPAEAFLAAPRPAPKCFGAAARDAARPCDNPALRYSATPAPEVAPLLPALPCVFVRVARPAVCAFGAPRRRAVGTIALLGDSHAPAWRAAVDTLARQRRWRGLTVARSSCPFAHAAHRDVGEAAAASCAEWRRDALRWLRRHPEIRTVLFVNSTGYRFAPAGGQDAHATAVAGYRAALDELPESVRHVVVIRDNPQAAIGTLPCVARAIARHRRADLLCPLPRERALRPDPAAEAAAQLAGDRGRVLDLSRFFCDDRVCYPVVGGALVFKDTSHLTRVFSRTLGPYLAADFGALGLPER